MAAAKTVQELNRELAQKLIDEGLTNPQSPLMGKFVGIANGQIVVIADDWDEVYRVLRETEPDPTKTYGVEVGRDYNVVHEIWGLR
jgi:hypothetical protein